MLHNRRWAYSIALAAAAIAGYFAITSTYDGLDNLSEDNSTIAETSARLGSLTIVTLNGGNLVGGSVYRISPDPFTGTGNYTIHDGDIGRDSNSVEGIVTIDGVADGTYSVIQVAGPAGQNRDIIPRVLTISNSTSEAVTFVTNSAADGTPDAGTISLDNIGSIIYAAKFECGTIRGTEGPLRPGHYDTDIGIFNKQSFPVSLSWTAASNDNQPRNAVLKAVGAQASSSIVCRDIRGLIGEGEDFVEGFVLLEVPVDPRLLSALSGSTFVVGTGSQDMLDVLDVQIFYTANALQELPHPVYVEKISFIISANSTVVGLPPSLIGRVVDITLPSDLGIISDPAEKIKKHLSESYGMSSEELAAVGIEIKSVDVGVGTMIDDHAISLSKVRPQPRWS